MSLFVLTAGDELYDCLVQAVPMEFVGKQFLLSVLCIITMLLLDKPRLACKFGISKTLGTVFEEIRIARESNGIVLPAQLGAITKFYKDVINSYLTYFGEINGFHDFDASVDSLPGHGDSWERNDKGFSKFHEMLKSIAYLCAPDDWNVPMPVYKTRFDPRKSPGYCYLKLFTPASVGIISNLLGALPTLECLLSVLVPKVLISPEEMDKLKIFRVDCDHSWRIALDEEVPYGQTSYSIHDVISHDSSRISSSRLDQRHTIRVTERIGSKLEDELQYSVFEKAMKILALSRSREAVAVEPIDKPAANETIIRDDLNSMIDCRIGLELKSDVELGGTDEVVELQRDDCADRLDRLRRFAKDHRHLLDDLIRDKKDRVCEDLEPDLRFLYEGQILRERDKLPFDNKLLIHLWLRALNELKRDFEVLLSDTSDGLVNLEKVFEDYFNK